MKAQQRVPAIEEDNLSQRILAKYLPYWPLFIGAILIGIVAAWFYMKMSTPLYEANATLIIKDEKKGNEESKLMESLNQISSKKIVENEIEVLQSRKLMADVATKLNLFTPITQEGSFRNRSAYLSSPVLVKAVHPESLNTKLNIPISFDKESKKVLINHVNWYHLNTPVKTPYGELEFVQNENYDFVPGKNTLSLSIYNPQDIVPILLRNLKAEPAGKLSSIVNLSYRDEVPQRAKEILNQLIDSYRQAEMDEKNSLAKNTMAFVDEQLGMVTKDLDSIQQQVQLFKSRSNAVDISTQGQLYLQNVSENNQKLSDVNTQISVLNQVEDFVKNKNNSGAIVPSTLGVSDPMLTQLLEKLNTLELEYEKGKATIGENNPELLKIQDQIIKIKPNILKNINSQQKSLYAMRNNIASTNNSYNSMLKQMPQKEKDLIDISREEQNKRELFQFLLQKKEESKIAYAASVANNKVVDYAAVGSRPVTPKKIVIFPAAVALLLFMTMGFVTIKESLTGKVLYRQDIESRTRIPVIGEITYDRSKKPIVIASGKRSFIAEEFRKLRLSLLFLGIDSDHKKILVTSSISGEGKSFVAANLAISLTLTGKKVVLLDMDLNNPTQEKIFNIKGTAGITEYLESSKDAEEIIRRIPEHENLYFISAGDLPENPAELLTNSKAAELIDYLNGIFDVVVIDTSPMALVTDGYMLTNLCDATLYVVRHQYTPMTLIKRIDANNHINPIHNPAIIFNGVRQRGFLAANYGYGYGYDYVYGYGKKNAKKKSIFEKFKI